MKKKIVGMLCLISVFYYSANAQQYVNNSISQYFQNKYLANPAFAGSHDHTFLYALYNQGWIGFEGAPSLVQIAADTRFGSNSAAGIQFNADKAGILKRSSVKLSYAYTVKLKNEDEYFKLGFSLTGYKQQVDNNYIVQDGTVDPRAKNFNSQKFSFDGDVGGVYNNKNFMASASFSNLTKWFPGYDAPTSNVEVFHLMSSYKISLENELEIQPLVSAKFFTSTSTLLSIGAQFKYEDVFHATLMWQNNKSIIGGVGVQLKDFGEANFFYGNGNNSQSLGKQYEIGIGINIK